MLAQLALGLRNRDIGARLFISERTVARHLVQINAKLGVSNRTAAVRAARERGLLSPTEERHDLALSDGQAARIGEFCTISGTSGIVKRWSILTMMPVGACR